MGYFDDVYSAHLGMADMHGFEHAPMRIIEDEFHFQQPTHALLGGTSDIGTAIISVELLLVVILAVLCICAVGLLCFWIGVWVTNMMSEGEVTQAAKGDVVQQYSHA